MIYHLQSKKQIHSIHGSILVSPNIYTHNQIG